ncbi:extracellular solute-binding protein [Paenibacillus mesophilus]|uniref:ABC transporter substrate-binding protein n=1 Tax=Paenibacillus mesophilus TaxID=2582849 RepID=UPI00110DBF54|nr:extracellular solute-binding protein [Paenibacillus mesophilus]TMV49946.1 extracellular solute-binding protein [Paenibacillus mesophilus]
MKRKLVLTATVLALLLNIGCQSQNKSGGKSTDPAEVRTEPVTLKFYVAYGAFPKEEFETYFVEPIKKKYPHITLEWVGGKLQDLISAGDVPDILMTGLPGIPGIQELQIIEDLNPYIKKFGTDLSKYDPVTIEAIKKFGQKGEMAALPFRMNIPALFYNKDLFDKFGIAYPKDGMTYEETFDLARRMTRSDGGVQYLGFYTGGTDRMAMGLSLPYVNKQTNEAVLTTDGWAKVLNWNKSLHDIPGYVKDGKITSNSIGVFVKDQKVAMAGYWGADTIGEIDKVVKAGQEFNWDMATLPTFEKGKGSAWQAEAHNMIVTATSKHKDQAYQVVSHVSGEEVQKSINKSGGITILKKTEETKRDYGADLAFLKGKNTNAFFTLLPGMHEHTKYDQKGRSIIVEAGNEVILKGTDVNTALRNAQDKLNQYIKEQTALQSLK